MLDKLKLAVVGSLILATVGHAQTYYSVDVTNDQLCIVDVVHGIATPIAPLTVHLDNVDLAWHESHSPASPYLGALYAKTAGGPAGNKICQIETEGEWTGVVMEGALLNGGGYQGVGEVAGLASNGIYLYLTYSPSNPNNNYSGSFGYVEPIWSGTINSSTNTAPTYDIDSLGFAGGKFWGIDVLTPQSSSGWRLYSGTTSPLTMVPNSGETYDLATNPLDLEYFSPTELVAVSQDGHNLVRINLNTGRQASLTPITGLQAGGVLKGIAMKPNDCPRLIRLP